MQHKLVIFHSYDQENAFSEQRIASELSVKELTNIGFEVTENHTSSLSRIGEGKNSLLGLFSKYTNLLLRLTIFWIKAIVLQRLLT
jgi:hypothetical protein